MPKADGVSRLAATVLVVVLSSAISRVQEPARVLSIAADSINELRQWDPVIDRLTKERALALRTVYRRPAGPRATPRRIESVLPGSSSVRR